MKHETSQRPPDEIKMLEESRVWDKIAGAKCWEAGTIKCQGAYIFVCSTNVIHSDFTFPWCFIFALGGMKFFKYIEGYGSFEYAIIVRVEVFVKLAFSM